MAGKVLRKQKLIVFVAKRLLKVIRDDRELIPVISPQSTGEQILFRGRRKAKVLRQ
jgi:hypothetical protein